MTKRILIIDSDTAEIQRMSDHLKQYDLDVFVSTSAHKGLEIFFDEVPDLLFINILMPDMPGVELIKKIRGRIEGAKVPLYLLSQLSSAGGSLIKDTKAEGIISKPVDLIEFDRAVHAQFVELQAAPSLAKSSTGPKKPASEIWRSTSLARLPLPKLLAQIYKTRATGILSILDSDSKVQIKFIGGNPMAFAPSAFAKFLVKKRYLKTNEAKELLYLTKKEGLDGRDALIRMKVVDTSRVGQILQEFAHDLVEEYSDQSRAKARFSDKSYQGTPIASTIEMVWFGVQKQYSLLRLDKIFSKDNRIKRKIFLTTEPDVLVGQPAPIRAVIDDVIRGKTLNNMLKKEGGPARKDLLQTAYALLICGLLTYNFDEAVEADLRPNMPPPKKPAPVEQTPPEPQYESPPIDPPQTEVAKQPTTSKPPALEEPPEPDIINADLAEEESAPEASQKSGEVMISSKELFNAATRLMEGGSYSRAQAYLEELVDRGVDRPEVLVNLSLTIYHNRFNTNPKERLLDVAWYIKQALSIDSNYIPAFLTFGKILEKEQKLDMAEDQYRLVLTLEPQNPKAQAALKRLSR